MTDVLFHFVCVLALSIYTAYETMTYSDRDEKYRRRARLCAAVVFLIEICAVSAIAFSLKETNLPWEGAAILAAALCIFSAVSAVRALPLPASEALFRATLLAVVSTASMTNTSWNSLSSAPVLVAGGVLLGAGVVLFGAAVVTEVRNPPQSYKYRRSLLKYLLQWLAITLGSCGGWVICSVIGQKTAQDGFAILPILALAAEAGLALSMGDSAVHLAKALRDFATKGEPPKNSKEMIRRRRALIR